jgi:hypothetical protein
VLAAQRKQGSREFLTIIKVNKREGLMLMFFFKDTTPKKIRIEREEEVDPLW